MEQVIWQRDTNSDGMTVYETILKGDGYQVRQESDGVWYATVRCGRIGYQYKDEREAANACTRTAGLGEPPFAWSW